MITATPQDLQRDPLGYLRRVEGGETVVVMRGATPVAEIKPASPLATQPRPFGLCAGQFKVPADFDEPLPDDIVRGFEGQ